MAYKITDIEGIGPANEVKLNESGIKSVEALLEAGKTKKGRDELATKTGISSKLILEWVNAADLFRLKGVSSQYAELLNAAGVDTVKELAQRNADNLHAKMVEVNSAKNLVRQTPSLDQVKGWVDQAKELPRVVEY